MEPVLTPPTNGDDKSVPEFDPEQIPAEQQNEVHVAEFTPTERAPETEPEAESDLETEPEADPDHETPPPPETDPAMTFADLKLSRALLDAITHAGYTHPTPIQENVIPPGLRGKDVIGQ